MGKQESYKNLIAERPQAKSSQGIERMTSIALGIVSSICLIWSLGAIGRGIWQLSQPAIDTELNSNNIADFSQVPNVTTGVFNYGGSTAWASLRLAVDSVIQSERPEVQLRYVQPQDEPPGSSPGIEMLLNGEVDFVQSSRPLRPEEYELAEQQGIQLKQVPVAVDSVAVAVNPSLNIAGLTLSQLQGIYTGEISNWQELGSADLPIVPYARPTSTGEINDLIDRQIFTDRQMAANVRLMPTATQALRQLAEDSGGIYYDSTATIVAQCTVKPLPLGESPDNLVAPYQKPLVPTTECPQRRNRINIQAL
ncbi:MAG: substrate-binding domain-containing protein, partial [Cyanobacteria bacterium P01_G01_bin.19]